MSPESTEATLARVEHRPDRASDPHAPVLVLLHGYGANEQDLVPLFRVVWPEDWGVSLAAPLELAPGYRAWFPLLETPDGRRTAEREPIEQAIADVVASLRACGAPDRPVFLAGFSQGGALAAAVGLRHPELVDGVAVLSGKWPYVLEAPAAGTELPFFVAHGRGDDVIPLQDGHDLAERLRALGAPVVFSEHPAGHSTHPRSLAQLGEWLTDHAATPAEAP